MKAFGKVVFALTNQKRVQAMISTRTRAKARTKKRVRKVLFLNLDFQPRKHPVKKEMALLESDDWSSSQWLDDSCTLVAGCFCTTARTAWMVAPSLNLANHPTQVIIQHHCAVLLNKDTFARDFSCTPIQVPCWLTYSSWAVEDMVVTGEEAYLRRLQTAGKELERQAGG